MTPDQLAEIKARADAATKGPWEAELWNPKRNKGKPVFGDVSVIPCDGVYGAMKPQDAVFIAHARTDVPALVAEVERLSLIESNLVQEIVRASFHTAEQVGAAVTEMMPIVALMQTAEVERLQAAVDAVREVHRQHGIVHLDDTATVACESCSVDYPCPTIRALDEHLGGGE